MRRARARHGRPGRDRRGGAGRRSASGDARRPGDARAAGRDAADRVHRAGLPGRPGLRGVRRPGTVHGTPLPAGLRLADRAARADVHPVDQGRGRPRREHRLRRGRRPRRAETADGGPRPVPRPLRAGRRPGRRGRASSSPTPSSSSAGRRRAGPVRRGGHAGLVAALAGRRGGAGRRRPPAFDKQPLRDWAAAQPWDKQPPPPPLPDEVVAATSARYVAAYERVTGRAFADWYGRRAAVRFAAARGGPAARRDRRPRGRHHRAGAAGPGLRRRRTACGPAGRFRFEVEADDEAAARRRADELADRLLANPVIEDATVSRRAGGAGLMAARVGVVVFPGTNCEHDVARRSRRSGAEAALRLAR